MTQFIVIKIWHTKWQWSDPTKVDFELWAIYKGSEDLRSDVNYQPNLPHYDTVSQSFQFPRFVGSWEHSDAQQGHISSWIIQGEQWAFSTDIMWPCFEIARRYEVEKNTAQAEVKCLSRKLADITNNDDDDDDGSGRGNKRRRARRDSSMDPDGSDNEKETINRADEHFVFQAGHKFFLLYGPWIRSGDGLFETIIDRSYNPSERFENDQNKSQGQLKEILDLLQVKFQPHMHQRWLRRQASCIIYYSITILTYL